MVAMQGKVIKTDELEKQAVGTRHLKILLVDSDLCHGEAMAQALASEPETTVQVAGTLREFKSLVAAAEPQQPNLLVIMDLALPDGSASEILSSPLEEAPFPVLIMINPGREEAALEAMEAGAIDYVVKTPGGFANMPHKIRRLLREWNLLQERRNTKKVIEHLFFGWQQTFNAIPYPVFLRDAAGVVTLCNQATLDFFGKTKEEIIGAQCWEFVHQTAEPIGACPMPAMLRSRQREIMLLPVAGSVFQVALDPVFNNDGVIVGAVHSMEDITERQRQEETLRAQEAELAAIYENAPFVMMLVDSARKVRKVNRLAISLAGPGAVDLIGHRSCEAMGCIYALDHPDGCGFGPHCEDCAVRRTVVDAIETGRSHEQVEVLITTTVEGREQSIPFLLSTSRLILRGEPLALVSFMDISLLKQAEESLRQTNERMTAILDSLNALIYVADMSTYEILFVNKYGREVWGEIEGQICWQSLQHDQDGPCAFCTNDKLLKEDGSPTGVYAWEVQNTKNGQWYDCRDQAIRWSDGRLVRIEIATDITERKMAEEQIRHSQKMDTIGTLAGGIAHDFNNILTSVLGFANLAHDELPSESQPAKDVQQVIYAGERAKELVKQILTFSRQRAEECQPVQASLLVKEALKLLRSSIPATIEIRDCILAQEQTIMIDPTKLHQVVMNLCTNAYQAMKAKGGAMSVALEPVVFAEGALFAQQKVEGEYLRLTVQDTGCGMDRATMERIFEPYFTTKGKEDGTGLGLSVVHGIVRNSKGFIAVQSTLEQGSDFQVIWPIVRQESLLQHQGPFVMPLPKGSEHVLLVDDEPAVLSTNERELHSLGYTVTSQSGPLEALAVFQQSPTLFDLVITDYAMPKMDGLALAQALRAISPGVKIVLTTGFSDVLTKETMTDIGIKKLLLKPVLRKDMALAIRAVLDEKA